MSRVVQRFVAGLCLSLSLVAMATAQTERPKQSMSIAGEPGQATVIQMQGHAFVDLLELARIMGGTITFENDKIVLTLPRKDAVQPSDDAARKGFSREFRRAAIEAMATMREWGGTLMITVQNGYPVGNTMAGNTIVAHEGRAAESVALAAAAASTESDTQGLALLRNEFNNMQNWEDEYIQARTSLRAANMTMSENALNNDQQAQKIIHCGQFLAQMFAGSTFQDDAMCH